MHEEKVLTVIDSIMPTNERQTAGQRELLLMGRLMRISTSDLRKVTRKVHGYRRL
jgi:hypothetical protein